MVDAGRFGVYARMSTRLSRLFGAFEQQQQDLLGSRHALGKDERAPVQLMHER
jgi:hypothetical protein